MGKVQSSCGQRAMVVIIMTTATVMVTLPVSIPSLLVLSMTMASHHGMQNPVHQPLRLRIAVVGRGRA